MTDPLPQPQTQRSLSGYKSKVSDGADFPNPNEGKPPLNEDDEYILRLTKFPHVKMFKQPKTRKDGSTFVEDVEKAVCEFQEETTGNIILAFFRVDKIHFSEDDSFQSGVIRFFKKIGHPLIEGVAPVWEDYFVVGMRFRSRVVVGLTDKKPNGNYYLDIPTCRKLQAGSEGPTAPQGTPVPSGDGLLANARFIAKGAKDWPEAAQKLKEANAPKEVVLALFQANFDGAVTFPI